MKSMRPAEPRLRKLPLGTSITTSTSGGSGDAWRTAGGQSSLAFMARAYASPRRSASGALSCPKTTDQHDGAL